MGRRRQERRCSSLQDLPQHSLLVVGGGQRFDLWGAAAGRKGARNLTGAAGAAGGAISHVIVFVAAGVSKKRVSNNLGGKRSRSAYMIWRRTPCSFWSLAGVEDRVDGSVVAVPWKRDSSYFSPPGLLLRVVSGANAKVARRACSQDLLQDAMLVLLCLGIGVQGRSVGALWDTLGVGTTARILGPCVGAVSVHDLVVLALARRAAAVSMVGRECAAERYLQDLLDSVHLWASAWQNPDLELLGEMGYNAGRKGGRWNKSKAILDKAAADQAGQKHSPACKMAIGQSYLR